MLAIPRTAPFRSFQKVAGVTTFHVNTIAIGLELIAVGGAKPPEMTVKWTPPKKPREAVEQTKHFVLLALMTHVVDAFDCLLRDYADVDWLRLPDTITATLRKSVTKFGGVSPSVRDRVEELLRHVGLVVDESVAFLDLTVSWRNALVHSGRARHKLSRSTVEALTRNRRELAQKYAGIDVCQTLANFEAGGWPTLKEATTMIAVAQNLARMIDRKLLSANACTAEQVELIARGELGKALAGIVGGWKRVWGRNPEARARVLSNLLSNAGIIETPESASSALKSTFVRDLASADRAVIERLVLSCKGD
jgi:hypothetical protein